MKLGLLTPYFLPTIGGAEIYVRDLAHHLIEAGNDVSVLTTNVGLGRQLAHEQTPHTGTVESIPVRRFRVFQHSRKVTRFFVSSYLQRDNIAREVMSMDFDVLHFHNVTDFTFPIALWNLKTPKVLTCHSLFAVVAYNYVLGPRLFFFKRILNRMDYIHVFSQRDVSILRRLEVDYKKVAVIPPGVSTVDFHPSQERKGKVLLFVGRISPEKSIETILLALRETKCECELWVSGPVQNARYLRNLRDRYLPDIKHKVRFLGPATKRELSRLYAEADVFVLPSSMEDFSIALLEAMASELPVISTDVGAARELITDGENGFVVPVGDWKCMAQRIALLLSNESLRSAMGRESRKIIEERFRAEECFSRVLDIYKDAVGLKDTLDSK
jgi:glycosyltransferase involved in cell wall biosynthesis